MPQGFRAASRWWIRKIVGIPRSLALSILELVVLNGRLIGYLLWLMTIALLTHILHATLSMGALITLWLLPLPAMFLWWIWRLLEPRLMARQKKARQGGATVSQSAEKPTRSR